MCKKIVFISLTAKECLDDGHVYTLISCVRDGKGAVIAVMATMAMMAAEACSCGGWHPR